MALRTLLLVLAAFALGISTGCEEVQPPQTAHFEQAEEALQRGDYDEAVRHYEAFLEMFPTHPLAPIAERRLTNIERELEAIMGRRSSPAPIYIRPSPPDAH